MAMYNKYDQGLHNGNDEKWTTLNLTEQSNLRQNMHAFESEAWPKKQDWMKRQKIATRD